MNGPAYEQLMLFPADSHASHSAQQGCGVAKTMTVISGRKCCELLKHCDRLGSLVKMLLESEIWHSMIFSLIWKPSTTPQGRLWFRLRASALHTAGIDSPYWPTPTVAGTAVLSKKRVMLLRHGRTTFSSGNGIRGGDQQSSGLGGGQGGDQWAIEPSVGRVADGVPNRMDRLKCLGNAVVPQVFFPIFSAIAEIEKGGDAD